MSEIKEYQKGNEWQRNRYRFMSEYNRRMGIREFSAAPGGEQPYYHLLLKKDAIRNFLSEADIIKSAEERFSDHKAGDLNRVLVNTVASQTCCFNLFVPLQKDYNIASQLFTKLLDKKVNVTEIVIEFTPETNGIYGDESIGDQSQKGGTDADVAVFYTADGKSGAILIEFKYIENEFSVCGSYNSKSKKEIRKICDRTGFYDALIEPNLLSKQGKFKCGYLKYNNWNLTLDSDVFDNKKIKDNEECPFRFSGQQLWRNLLLAENVAKKRNLDEFAFWVLSPAENTFLWKEDNGTDVEADLRKVLTPSGNSLFRRFELDIDFFQVLKPLINSDWMNNWANKFEERYLSGTRI
jgi:hypothetical protein